MKKHRNKLTSNGDAGAVLLQHAEDKLERDLAKNVELCLEVEMDDEVRELIKSPKKCASTLLDVMVIKPKELDDIGPLQKTTLNTTDVCKLIGSMEIENADKKRLLERIFGTEMDPIVSTVQEHEKRTCNLRETCYDFQEQNIRCTGDDRNSMVFSKYDSKSLGRVQQVYTTPKTHSDLKAVFTCKNKDRHEQNQKPDKPCLCQNCAIVGIVSDSQKKPFATEETHDPREKQKPCRRRSVNFRKEDDVHKECQFYFRHLSERIHVLEQRLAQQEERSVPRDYFKRIITKLVHHMTRSTHEERHSPPSSQQQPAPSPSPASTRYKQKRYIVNTALVDSSKKKELEHDPSCGTPSFWKWGSDVLKPGKDLKNKIVVMLEDTLQGLKKTWERAPKEEKGDEELRTFVQELSKNLYKAVKQSEMQTKDVSSVKEKSLRSSMGKRRRTGDPRIDVAYLNPKLEKWNEESQVSFSVETDLESHHKVQNDRYRMEFLKTLERTNVHDRFKLWQSIWNQVLANGQKKADKITIQVPDPRNPRKCVAIEYTIAEMEKLLTGKVAPVPKKNK